MYGEIIHAKEKEINRAAFVSPWIIGFLTLVAYPLTRTIFFSFHNVSYGIRSGWRYNWVGWENYDRILFQDIDFVIALQDFCCYLVSSSCDYRFIGDYCHAFESKIHGNWFFRLVFFYQSLS